MGKGKGERPKTVKKGNLKRRKKSMPTMRKNEYGPKGQRRAESKTQKTGDLQRNDSHSCQERPNLLVELH